MKRSPLPSLVSVLALAIAIPVSAQVSFGASAVVGDGEVFVGEPGHDLRSGLVYVYERAADGSWALGQSLEAPSATPGDRFGAGLAVEGDRLLVSAPEAADGRGAVYTFRRAPDAWESAGRLALDDDSGDGLVAEAMDIDGEWALLGTTTRNEGRGESQMYRWTGDAWEYHSTLAVDDLVADDLFGGAVLLDGERAFVSAPAKGDGAGAIYAFAYDAAAETWTQTGRVGSQIQQPRTAFGAALAMVGDRLFIAGPGLLGVGAVVGFRPIDDGREYVLETILLPFDGTGGGFGVSLATAGNDLWAGIAESGRGEGRAFVYRADEETGEWVGAEKVAATDLSRGDAFGLRVASAGDVMVASALGQDFGAGAVYVFERDGDGWSEASRLVSEVTGPSAITGGEVGCSDEGYAALFGCSNVDLLSFLPMSALHASRGVEVNDIWGWTDPETGRDIVIVGMYDASAFVDVTDPENPVYLGRLPMTEGARPDVWRDMKVYSDHVFIVADGSGEHGMQVFDLTRLRGLDGSDPPTFDADAVYREVNEAHNIVINDETGFAYIVGAGGGGRTCGAGLHMVDIRDPLQPTFAGCFADPSTGRSNTGYTHDAQCVIYRGPDEAYQGREICFGANETALSIADVTDKDDPVAVASASYPNVGYSHQGWLSEDHRYFFMGDETDEIGGQVASTRTLVWDVQELEDPILVKEHLSENRSSDHNLYIVGTTMYQSNYNSGLRVLDVSDPENPVQVGYFDTVPFGEDAPAMEGSFSNYPFFESGVVVVTSGREGLFVLRHRPQGIS